MVTAGPTVDGVYLGSVYVYGIVALLAGRGFDFLVMGLPLAVGTMWGTAIGRRLGHGPALGRRKAGGYARLAIVMLVSGLLAVLVLGLMRPATTAPVASPHGQPLRGSVAGIGGHGQSIMICGHDRDNPVLLFLEGGPGGSAVGAMRASGQGLEEDFVMAVWDQRGTGKSLPALEPTATLTVERMIADTVDVTDYLWERFGQEKIYLVGSSWGSTLGCWRSSRPRSGIRLHRDRADGQPAGDRPADVRRDPGLGRALRQHRRRPTPAGERPTAVRGHAGLPGRVVLQPGTQCSSVERG